MNKNEINSKPQRAQGGMGLLSRTISVPNPQVSMAKNPSTREERERTERERGGWRQEKGEVVLFWLTGARERERRGRGVFKVPTQRSKIPSTQNRH